MGKRRGPGDGALYKREDGLWIGRVDVPPGPDGKRRVKSVSSKDRATAAEKLRKLQADIAVGEVVTGPASTVGEWLDYWLANIHRSKVKPGTRQDYARVIRNHIKPHIGAKRLSNLQPEDVLAMQQAITPDARHTGAGEDDRGHARGVGSHRPPGGRRRLKSAFYSGCTGAVTAIGFTALRGGAASERIDNQVPQRPFQLIDPEVLWAVWSFPSRGVREWAPECRRATVLRAVRCPTRPVFIHCPSALGGNGNHVARQCQRFRREWDDTT